MATFGSIPSTFAPANALFDLQRQDMQGLQFQRNRLALQAGQQDLEYQSFERDRNEVARASASIMSLPPEQRPQAYAAAVQELQARGFARRAPAQYPGDAQIEALARQGMSATEQFKLVEQRAARDAFMQGLGLTPAAPAAPGIPAPMGGAPAAPAGGDWLTTLQREENSTGNPAARNPRSSATGDFQFIDSTWLQYADANPDRFQGMSREQILARRADPAESRRAAEWYARENASTLTSLGLPAGPPEQALSHRFGSRGAAALLTAAPDTPAGAVLGDQVIAANPNLRGQTAGQIVSGFRSRFGGAGQGDTTPASGNVTPVASAAVPDLLPNGLTQQQASSLAAAAAAPGANLPQLSLQAQAYREQNRQAARQAEIDARQAAQQAEANRRADEAARRADEQQRLAQERQRLAEERERRQAERGSGRPLPSSERTTLVDTSGRLSQLEQLRTTFQNDYGGFVTGFIGDTANAIARNTPGASPRADWWQGYQALKNVVRNQLFGAALTGTERAEFEKADITPGMSPETIRSNLDRQVAIVRQAINRRARSLRADGYNTMSLEEATGLTFEDAQPAPEERAAAPSAPQQTGGAMTGAEALARARQELGPNASDDALVERARAIRGRAAR